MTMGTAQKQNISVQHRIWNKNRRPQPMSFKEWMRGGVEHYQSTGITFELVTPSMMRIRTPGKVSMLRTCADFAREYREEYLSKF